MARFFRTQRGASNYQESCFDPAAAFQLRQEDDPLEAYGADPTTCPDEVELLKAAKTEIKTQRGQLDQRQKSKIAEAMLSSSGDTSFADRLAEVLK